MKRGRERAINKNMEKLTMSKCGAQMTTLSADIRVYGTIHYSQKG